MPAATQPLRVKADALAEGGPGTAALVRCLQCVREYLSAGVGVGSGTCRLIVKEIDAALASSPKTELAAAIGGEHVSPRERDVVAAVLEYRRANNGCNPSLGELGRALGITKVAVHQHLNSLACKGVIVRDLKHAARQIRFVRLDGRTA